MALASSQSQNAPNFPYPRKPSNIFEAIQSTSNRATSPEVDFVQEMLKASNFETFSNPNPGVANSNWNADETIRNLTSQIQQARSRLYSTANGTLP